MKTKKYIVSVVALVAVFALAGVGTVFATHSWNGYHWARTSNPFTLKLGDNVSGAWDAVLAVASSDWSASDVLNTAIVATQSNKSCRATSGRVEVCNRTYGGNGWLGLAQVWVYANGHIAQGTVKLNDTYFNTSTYNNPQEKLHVMCQEIGHTLGLDHQSEDGSSQDTCMDYFSNTGVNASSTQSTHPNQHDYDQLGIIYAHLDTTTTLSSAVDGGGKGKPSIVGQDIDLNDPSAWGQAVRQDARGRNSLYERDLRNGQKLFTFVTWAEL